MNEHATYGRDLDFQLHTDLEDELMGAELPCPLSPMPLGLNPDKAPCNDDPADWDCDVEPDDPDAEGYPEDDDGSCEDFCDDDFLDEDEED